MTKRRLILLLLAAVAMAVGAIVFLIRPREPSYKGRSLSELVEFYGGPGRHTPGRDAAVDNAIREIGTNAIPFLLEWIQQDKPGPPILERIGIVLPDTFRDSRPHINRASGVPDAFAALGPKANLAVPALASFAEDTNHFGTAVRAAWALGKVGPAGLTPLLALFTNEDRCKRLLACLAIGYQGTNATPAVPVLLRCQETNGDPTVTALLGYLAIEPQLVVPALTRSLTHTNEHTRSAAAEALRNFGPRASPAAPALLVALRDANRDVRAAATNALREIAPDLLTNTPPP